MTPVEHLSSNEEELSGDSPLPRALRQQPRSHVQENMAEQRKNQSGDSPLPSSIKDEHRSAMTRQQSRSRVVSAEHCYALTESMAKQTKKTIKTFFALPFNDLLFQAQAVHRQHHDPNAGQASTLLNIKSGGCQEDCAYCPQAARYNTGVEAEKLLDADTVLQAAKSAKNAGASRFCMGAAWRELKDRDLPKLATMIEGVKSLGLESCMTLGMLKKHQANALKEAGLDYYNHNLDTSPEFYGDIISTRTYRDRLDTLEHVRDAGMKTCCGGIVGMGESVDDRIGLLHTLANLPKPPESIPINMLVRIEGTPLAEQEDLDIFDFIRTIAVARILMPKSYVRLSAGREQMTDEAQALCFLAGANSIFYGDTLLTTSNPQVEKDQALLERLGMRLESLQQDD